MVNFVIVEDNPLHMKKTEEYIVSYMMQNTYDFKVQKFEGLTNDFDKYASNTQNNNVYILDFELGNNTTAIDVARRIRQYEWKSPIIVFTVNGGMAFETFKQRLQILDFINKQVEPTKNLHELFDICFDQLNLRRNFKYRVGQTDVSIDFPHILYVYKDTVDRKSVIVTDNGEFSINMTLRKTKSLLGSEFMYTHKSYVVNMSRITMLDWKNLNVIFDNGRIEPLLSRTHKKELTER